MFGKDTIPIKGSIFFEGGVHKSARDKAEQKKEDPGKLIISATNCGFVQHLIADSGRYHKNLAPVIPFCA